MRPSESIYNLLLESWVRVTEEFKFEVTTGIYVEVDLNFRARTASL